MSMSMLLSCWDYITVAFPNFVWPPSLLFGILSYSPSLEIRYHFSLFPIMLPKYTDGENYLPNALLRHVRCFVIKKEEEAEFAVSDHIYFISFIQCLLTIFACHAFKGIMSWGRTTLPMLLSSMIVVEQRMRQHLAVLPASIFHMMTSKQESHCHTSTLCIWLIVSFWYLFFSHYGLN